MNIVTFTIEDADIPIETIWVHFQNYDSPDARQFALSVPAIHVKNIFDPHSNCPASVRLDKYLMDLISELGTFVVGGIIKNILQLLQRKQAGYRWVVAAVEQIKETNGNMVLHGKVVPFKSEVPVFKKLE